MTEIIVLPRFLEEIRTHLLANYLEPPIRPLILGIFGRPGDGKSAQLMTALERLGVRPLRINAADLESGTAGEPGKLVERTYAAASLDVNKGNPCAIIVDDIDTTVGEWQHNTGTVNHQQVLAELMHLADRPVDPLRNHLARVPIFVTGNDLRKLYPPLRRHKRMHTFPWRPDAAEVRFIIETLFQAMTGRKELDELARQCSSEPLSFFGALHQAAMETQLRGVLSNLHGDMREVLSRRHLLGSKLGSKLGSNGAKSQLAPGDLLKLAATVRAKHKASMEDFLIEASEEPGAPGAPKPLRKRLKSANQNGQLRRQW